MNHPEQPQINLGLYQHYKGKLYDVIDVACHSETLEWYVVYKAHDTNEGHCWIRPYHMFFEVMTIDGKAIPRFQHLRGSAIAKA